MTGQGFSLNLLMEFIFSTDCEITDDLKNSDFIKINAAAIAYPFLRSFVANLTLQAGYPSVILPTINFVSFFEEENRSNS